MTARLRDGQTTWSLTRDSEGYREYKIKFLVECDVDDGPLTALSCPGLPRPGDQWQFDNDSDPYVWCRPDATVEPKLENEPNRHFEIGLTFSNKPPDKDKQRCNDTPIEDPLLEPMKVSGGYKNMREEAVRDRFGAAIVNSAHEQIRGPQVEFDRGRDTVRIEQNVPVLQLDLVAGMKDTVNDAPLWGMPRRCIKLTSYSWERKFHGQCSVYYTRTFEFDIAINDDGTSGHDKDLLDEGSKCISGHWGDARKGEPTSWVTDPISRDGSDPDPDPTNPAHFIRAKDRQGENIRVILNGHGVPIGGRSETGTGSGADTPGNIHVEKYHEANFLLLGIPLFF